MIIVFVVIYLIYRICCYVKSKRFDALKEFLYFILAQHQNWFLTLNSSIKNRSLHSNKILFS